MEKNCFLCRLSITKSGKMWEVSTLEIKNKTVAICNMRNDNWTSEILGRINSCADLPAVEAQYHVKCLLSSDEVIKFKRSASLQSLDSNILKDPDFFTVVS